MSNAVAHSNFEREGTMIYYHKDLDVDKSTRIIRASIAISDAQAAKLLSLIKKELGQDIRPENPWFASVKSAMDDVIAGQIPRYLLSDDPVASFITPEGKDYLFKIVMEKISQNPELPRNDNESPALESSLRALFDCIDDLAISALSTSKAPFDVYVKWVNAPLEIANQEDPFPIEVVLKKNYADDIIRRLYTHEAYIAYLNHITSTEFDARKIVEVLLRILLEREQDLQRREAIKRFFSSHKDDLISKLQRKLDKARPIITIYAKLEADRIYGACGATI